MNCFPSKILLFGEYSILAGSMGLAIPYPAFGGKLAFPKDHDRRGNPESVTYSNLQLIRLADYCRTDEKIVGFLDCDRFRKDAEEGLFFDSDIPQGYGLGSSGALTAAIYSQYERKERNEYPLCVIRSRLASIEKYFHGTSSGLDPLVSHTKSPVLINETGDAEKIDNLPSGFLSGTNAFLIDTKTKSNTGNLVRWFKEQIAIQDYGELYQNSYLPIVNRIVNAAIQNDISLFFELAEKISAWQIEHFAPMIPDFMMNYFKEGLSSGCYSLKLCGSGGGGFMLGFTKNREAVHEGFLSHDLSCQFL